MTSCCLRQKSAKVPGNYRASRGADTRRFCLPRNSEMVAVVVSSPFAGFCSFLSIACPHAGSVFCVYVCVCIWVMSASEKAETRDHPEFPGRSLGRRPPGRSWLGPRPGLKQGARSIVSYAVSTQGGRRVVLWIANFGFQVARNHEFQFSHSSAPDRDRDRE